MEITGRLLEILPIQTGRGKNGVWKKQEIILELAGTDKKLCFTFVNDRINSNLVEGSILIFDIDSREIQSKWFTILFAWKVEDVCC